MLWQRLCLATGLALGAALVSQAAWSEDQTVQTDNPPSAAAAPADAAAPGNAPAPGPAGPQANPPAGNAAANPAPAPAANPANAPAASAPDDNAAKPAEDAAAPAPQNSAAKVVIDVDLSTQRMHVDYPDGSTDDWPIASGRPGLDTPDGKYKVQWMDKNHISEEYDAAPMPYAMFFDLKGHAIHGAYQKQFGAAVSHGCVRLPVEDAKKLFEAVKLAGGEVEIVGRARRSPAYIAQRRYYERRYAENGYGETAQGFWPHPNSYPAYPGRAYRRPQQQGFFGFLFGE